MKPFHSSMFVLNFVWKARRKDKDPSPAQAEETKQYLHAAMLECTMPEAKIREIVNHAEGLDYNEWIASHTLAFFDHVNLLYGTISEFCSMSGCPDMSGPCNRQYLWVDEKGKRCKVAAPQYIDYVMIYTQKTIHDESVFPTKFDKEFPPAFESIVKKIHRLLYHVIAHIYHSHFKELVLLNLHPHLNCIFAHLILFNERFKLIDEKELEVLHDLAIALKLCPPLSPVAHVHGDTSSSSGLTAPGGATSSLGVTPDGNNNNNSSSLSGDYGDNNQTGGVISTQCRSISAYGDYKNVHFGQAHHQQQESDLADMKENEGNNSRTLGVGAHLDGSSPMMVDEPFEESKGHASCSSPEPMLIEPMTSSENLPPKCAYPFDVNVCLRGRSISDAVLTQKKSQGDGAFTTGASGGSPLTSRRCNSDRTASTSSTASYAPPGQTCGR